MVRMRSISHLALPALIACGAMASPLANAQAQSRPMTKPPDGTSNVQVRVGGAPAAMRAQMGVSRIEKYARVLGLDATKTSAAKDLYEAYQRDSANASKKMQDSMRDAQEDMSAGDHAAFEKGIQKTMAEQAAASEKLTSTFLSDLRSLLRPEQADRWAGFERLRRREQYLNSMMSIGGMGVGGSSVDLIPIVEKLSGGVPESARAKVAEVMGMYEVDIDRPLKDRQQNFEDERKSMGAVQNFDGESFKKKLEKDRKVDLAVREVNLKYVGLISGALPEDVAKTFADNYQVRAFRSIYRESSVSKKLALAQQIPGLTADQKSRLKAAQEAYKADARRANDAWAAAQQRAETEGRPTGGGLMMMGPGVTGEDKIDPAVADARSARRAIDDAARQKLEGILTAEQLAEMPKPQQGMMGGHAVSVISDGTGEDMVFVGDLDMGDDLPPEGGGGTVIIRTVEVGGHGGGGEVTRPGKKPD